MRDRRCLHKNLTIFLLVKRALACFPNPICDHVHRSLEFNLLPLPRVWRAIFHFLEVQGVSVKLESIGALGTQMTM